MSKEQSTALVSMQEAMRNELATLNQRIETSSNFVNLSGKKFTFPDKSEHTGPISGVVLDFISLNTFYDTAYKKGTIVEPACKAVGQLPSEMAPSPGVTKPQSQTCAACPQNQWGSGNGDGKACQNTRVLAIVQPDRQKDGDILLIKVSPTGIRHFDKYAASVGSRFQTPLWGVVTEISFSDDTYPSLRFNFLEPNKDLEGAYSRKNEATGMLTAL